MIKLLFISTMFVLSCGSVKTNQTVTNKDSVQPIVTAEQSIKDSIIRAPVEPKTQAVEKTALPNCIKNKIDSFRLMQKHEQPQSVKEYMYKGKKVYYIVMSCCDFFNEVYDDKCKFLGSPDGGITGKGDGKLPGFFKEVSKEKLIWKAAK